MQRDIFIVFYFLFLLIIDSFFLNVKNWKNMKRFSVVDLAPDTATKGNNKLGFEIPCE